MAATTEDAQEDDDDDDDEEMEDGTEDVATASTPPALPGREQSGSMVSLPSLSQITSHTASPSIFSSGAGRHYSISSASQASYSPYIHSNQASPAFGPQLTHINTAPLFSTAFGLGSPALKPVDSGTHTLRQIAGDATELSDRQQRRPPRGTNGSRSDHELDHEAAAALSMLNNDRRSWRPADAAEIARSNTGMSVRDLLSG